MLAADVIETADRWWAREFPCPEDLLRPTTAHVQGHAGKRAGDSGIWILVAGAAPLISLPAHATDELVDRARAWTSALVADAAALAEAILPLRSSKIVGPAFIGYGTASTLALSAASRARALTSDDAPAVARLREACTDEGWDHGGSDLRAMPCFGVVDTRGEVLALAGYRTWANAIAHISIVSVPSHQRRGHATAAVACAAQHALASGLLPQYRTLAANAPSMKIATRLGFVRYGFSVYMRLPDAGSVTDATAR